MSLFAELKRRNVIKVALAYLLIAWVLLQGADFFLDVIGAPGWVIQALLGLAALGLPAVLLFAWIFELTPEGLKREYEVDPAGSIAPQTGRRLDRTIIVLLVLVVAWFAFNELILERAIKGSDPISPEMGSDPVSQSAAGTSQKGESRKLDPTPLSVPDTLSIAVLPFVNMSGDPENEYFSDGLTETLLHMLAQLPELRVAARTSSFAFKGKDTSISEIASTLGVAHILEGSVQKSGDRVRVTAQLIRSADGFHVWSQNYTRPLQDIFAIQDEIATDVARALDASLLSGGERLQAPDTASVSAYDTYLKAMEQQAIFSFASLGQAEGLFKQALAIDPAYVDAKLGLARNVLMKHATGLLDEAAMRAQLEPLLRQVRNDQPDDPLARALELVMELQVPTVMSKDQHRAMVGELRELLRAVPTESYIRSRVASQLVNMGQDDSALDVLQAGLLIDPLSAYLHSRMGDVYTEMKRWDDAERALLRSVELDPRDPGVYFRLAELRGDLNDVAGRLDWLRRATEVDPQDHEYAANMAYLFYQLGLPEEGDRWARRVAALAPGSDIVRALASEKAWVGGDWSRAMEIGAEMIRDQASFRQGSFPIAMFNFVDAAAQLGQAREGYDVLVSARPEAGDFSVPPPDLHVSVMRWGTASLMTAFAAPQDVHNAWAAQVRYMDEAAFPWREDNTSLVFDAMLRGDLDDARRILLEKELAEPLANWPARIKAYQSPLFAAVVSEPRVASRIAELERERTRMREEVSGLLLQPEWQP